MRLDSSQDSLLLEKGSSTQSLAEGASNRLQDSNEGALGKIMQRTEILKMISYMNASVGIKTAEQGLLKLKQKFPNSFNDLCLYSEVGIILTKHAFRLPARRFIQELFMSLTFEELDEEPKKMLLSTTQHKRHK